MARPRKSESELYKRGNTYYANIISADGSRLRKSLGVNNLKDALEVLRVLKNRIEVDRGSGSIAEMDMLFHKHQTRLKISDSYAGIISGGFRMLYLVYGRAGFVNQIEMDDLIERLSSDYSPTTISINLRALRSLFNKLRALGLMKQDNPITSMAKVKSNRRIIFLTDEDIDRLKNIVTADRDYSPQKYQFWGAAHFYLVTGCRRSELLPENLKVSGIDYDNLTASFYRPKIKDIHTAAINGQLADILRNFTKGKQPFDPVFPDLTVRYIVSNFRRIKSRLNFNPEYSIHTLRHTCASRMLRHRPDVVAVQQQLGHGDIQTTMRYIHLVKGQVHRCIPDI